MIGRGVTYMYTHTYTLAYGSTKRMTLCAKRLTLNLWPSSCQCACVVHFPNLWP